MTRWFKGAAFAGMLGFGAMSFLNAAAYGEPGVFDDRIVFGQSAAFDGPAAALGLGMREGILAAFNNVNVSLLGPLLSLRARAARWPAQRQLEP